MASSAVACPRQENTCSIPQPKDIQGHTFLIIQTNFASDCCWQCDDTPKCLAYSWNPTTKECAFKDVPGPLVDSNTTQVGIVGANLNGNTGCSLQLDNSDVVGNIINSFPTVDGIEQCCQACKVHPACKTYVFNRANGYCLLKSVTGKKIFHVRQKFFD